MRYDGIDNVWRTDMNIIFMGTPDFAAMALEEIIKVGHNVLLVVTQPDKEKGRGKVIQKSDVKLVAEKYGLPIFQPVRIKRPEAIEYLKQFEAEAFVVAAFGQILSREILDMPKYGCINIHASLLPKYRGAAPIQWSIINGDEYTGVTIMQMNEGIDTGDILLSRKIKIEDDDNAGVLFDKLAKLGAELIVEALPQIEQGGIMPTKQDDSQSSYAGMLSKDMGNIDWTKSASVTERLVRGCNPWPSAYSYLDTKTLKIWNCSVKEDSLEKNNKPGTIECVDKNSFTVCCGVGSLVITEVQLEGKKRMSVHDFLLGYKLNPGQLLG